MTISKIVLHGASLLALATPLSAMAQTNPQPNDAPAPEAPAARDNAAGGQVPSTAETNIGLDSDIVVTARRREESIQDVPQVINVVTADDIAKLNFREFNEVQNLVPGLQLEQNSNGIAANARLRGVNNDTNASGFNPTVEFYLNDAPITSGVIQQQMYDVGQIEVLRGPQGTLRGRASPSGSITVTTRKPDLTDIGGFAEITGNDIGTINGQAALNVPVIRDIAAIRVAGLYDENEGNRVRPLTRAFGGEDPRNRTLSGRVSALVEPTDWLRFEGVYQRIDRFFRQYNQVESFSEVNPGATGGTATNPVLTANPELTQNVEAKDRRSNSRTPTNIVRQKFDIYNWRAEAAFSGQRLIYQGQHYTQKLLSSEDTDPANAFPQLDTAQRTRSRSTATSHEVRLQNEERVAGMFDYVLGLFDNKTDAPTTLTRPAVVINNTFLGPPILPVPPGTGVALAQVGRFGGTHEQSYFGNLTAHIGESAEVSGGLRYIRYKDDGRITIVAPGQAPVDRETPPGGRKERKLIYTASVKYNVTPDILIYAATGSSFRPSLSIVGDFSATMSAQEMAFLNPPSETSKSYEIGFKSTLFDEKVRFNVTAFHQKFKNFPLRIPGSGVFFLQDNGTRGPTVNSFNFVGAVPVEVNGVEGDLSYNISDRWNIGLTASYSIGRVKNGTIPCNDLNGDGQPDAGGGAPPSVAALENATGGDSTVAGLTGDRVGSCQVNQRASFLPPFSATIQSEYSLPLSDRFDAFVRGLFTFNGKSQSNPNDQFDDVSRYGLLNLYVGVRDPDSRWEVTAFAKNVFDTTRALGREGQQFTSFTNINLVAANPPIASTGGTATSPFTRITTTPPREFGLTVKYRFGTR